MNTLLTQSLKTGDVHLLFNFPRQLLSKFENKMVQWVVDYTAKYSTPPTLERFLSEQESFIPLESDDPLGDIYDRTLVKKRNIFAREYLVSIQEELKGGVDPLPHIEELHLAIAGGNADIVSYTKFDRSTYYRRPTTYPYGIPQVDHHTGGISRGDLVYLVGRLGIGKTTVAIWLLQKWLLQGLKILMVSNENRADDVVAKIDSFIGGFNPLKKRTVSWTAEDRLRLDTVSFIASHLPGEVYIPNRPVQEVKEIRSLIYSYKPDVVIVDGIYLMKGESAETHWEKITNVSRQLKQIAEGEGVPMLGVHQANRNAAGKRMEIEHVAYADALAQDADMMFGINAEDDGSIFIEALKNRWGKGDWGFFVRFYFESMSVKVMDARTSVMEGKP